MITPVEEWEIEEDPFDSFDDWIMAGGTEMVYPFDVGRYYHFLTNLNELSLFSVFKGDITIHSKEIMKEKNSAVVTLYLGKHDTDIIYIDGVIVDY